MTTDKDTELEQRIQRLEEESALRRLVSRFGYRVDDHDVEGIMALFASGARYYATDRSLDLSGRTAIKTYFQERLHQLGPTNHFTHDHVIEWGEDGHATGLVNAHTEVAKDDLAVVVSLRYYDRYLREDDDEWRFLERRMSVLYYCPVADYPKIWESRARKRGGPEPMDADHPEALWP